MGEKPIKALELLRKYFKQYSCTVMEDWHILRADNILMVKIDLSASKEEAWIEIPELIKVIKIDSERLEMWVSFNIDTTAEQLFKP